MLRRVISSLAIGCFLFAVPALRAEDKFFDSNGVKIRYTIEGKGEPVLLIHGYTANIEKQWGPSGVISALAKHYQVIALDNRGHGKSGKPHDVKKYGMEMVEDAVRLLDHLKIAKAHVVGYSMGAMLTNKLIVTHPERVLSGTLGGAAGVRAGGKSLEFFNLLADSLEQGKGFQPLIMELTPPGQPKPTDEQIKTIDKFIAADNDIKALAAVARGFKDLAISDEKLKANRVPTLAIIGENDPLKKGIDELRGQMGALEMIAVIAGTDHVTAFAHPDFAKNLQEYLGKHRAK